MSEWRTNLRFPLVLERTGGEKDILDAGIRKTENGSLDVYLGYGR
jgi:hypothetical protein